MDLLSRLSSRCSSISLAKSAPSVHSNPSREKLHSVKLTLQKANVKSDTVFKRNYRTPSVKFQNALDRLPDKKSQWETLIEAINDVRELSSNHPEILIPKVNENSEIQEKSRPWVSS